MTTFVYFLRPIGMTGPIKIGTTRLTRRRLAEIALWSPFPLEVVLTIPGGIKLERNLHECFFESHTHYEWFAITPRLATAIEAMQRGVPVAEAVDLTKRVGSIRKKVVRKPKTPGVRAFMAVTVRLHAAARRAARLRRQMMWVPEDAWGIAADLKKRPDGRMTNAEAARIEEICAHAETLCLTRSERFPPLRSVA